MFYAKLSRSDVGSGVLSLHRLSCSLQATLNKGMLYIIKKLPRSCTHDYFKFMKPYQENCGPIVINHIEQTYVVNKSVFLLSPRSVSLTPAAQVAYAADDGDDNCTATPRYTKGHL